MKLNLETWQRWETHAERIVQDLRSAVDDQQIFDEFQSVCVSNQRWLDETKASTFCLFVYRCFAARAALAVRRHSKNNAESVSLARLMDQIRKSAGQITFAEFLNRHPRNPDGVPWQESAFAGLSSDGHVVSPKIVEEDQETLRSLSANIEALADRQLAHLDKRGFDKQVTLREIATATREFASLAGKYTLFITGQGHGDLASVFQVPWQRAFQYPFVEPTTGSPGNLD